jgi:mRNA-degrading endonuclease toxin of MazEF toxin-antitoxin module
VVLCNQVRSVDLKVRRAQFVESASAEVLARVATLIE